MSLRGIVTTAQEWGPRDRQEDRILHFPFHNKLRRGHLLAVMDGHGGEEAADHCKKAIPRLLDPSASNLENELREMVKKLDSRTTLFESGTTLSVAMIDESNKTVTTVLLGDSPIIVVDKKGEIHISEEHNVRTNLEERIAVLTRGGAFDEDEGYVYDPAQEERNERIQYAQFSRSLGDQAMRRIVSREPAINTYGLNSRSCVVVASDGLFDPYHEMDRAELARQIASRVKSNNNAAEILTWRMNEELKDNTSVVIWRAIHWTDWFRTI
jgi:serine/threonine protein phosphatase PrpC